MRSLKFLDIKIHGVVKFFAENFIEIFKQKIKGIDKFSNKNIITINFLN